MDKPLKSVVLLSLEDMALRRVASLLCNDSVVLSYILTFLDVRFKIDATWQQFAGRMKKISELELTKSLEQKVIDNIQYVGLEIRRWQKFHEYKFKVPIEKMYRPDGKRFCWTSTGAIDYGKTAEEYIRCDRNFFPCPYKLASFYCLEDYIPVLWAGLSALDKNNFLNISKHSFDLGHCWSHIIKGRISGLVGLWHLVYNVTSFYQWAFEQSVSECNKSATEHFFQKLTLEERNASLVKSTLRLLENSNKENFQKKKVFDVVCYLLCAMTEEQQMEVLRARPAEVMLCFLDSQWQDLFEANAGLIWGFLSPDSYADVFNKFKDGFLGSYHHFPNVLEKFLNQSPHSFKEYFVVEKTEFDCSPAFLLLWHFFDSDVSELAEVLFRCINPEDRVKLVFQEEVIDLFYDTVAQETCHTVELCLRIANLSKEDRKRWKDGLVEYLKSLPLEPDRWTEWPLGPFLESFDEADDARKKSQKRKLESSSPE